MTKTLHRIIQWPVDLSEPIYAHYPLFKMGVRDNVLYYAQRLAPIVAGLMDKNSMMTSPEHIVLPCAANLLCSSIAGLLRVPAVDIRFQRPTSAAHEYSLLSWQDRVASLKRNNHLIVRDASFAGRTVVFINDIKVTGAQQRNMQLYFDSINAAAVHWFYIFEVEEAIGREQPQLEYALNHADNLSAAGFARVLNEADIRYTTKCIARLMAYEASERECVLASLSADRREEILRLIAAEGRYG